MSFKLNVRHCVTSALVAQRPVHRAYNAKVAGSTPAESIYDLFFALSVNILC